MIKAEEGASTNGSTVTLGRAEFDTLCAKLNGLENSIAELRRELSRTSADRNRHDAQARPAAVANLINDDSHATKEATHYDTHGIHTHNDNGEIVHLGAGSVPAMLFALGQGQGQSPEERARLAEFLGKSVLPLFGLDNESATYPFVDLWGLPHGSLQRARELAKALPNDTQCVQLFRQYRDVSWVIYPGVAQIDVLEQDLSTFLLNRAAVNGSLDGVTDQNIYGKSYHWLAVLFAVLGSGAQCSNMPRRERELTSQVYICCSFECLRFTNFLSQPHLESIQALLVMSYCITNNMNAGTSWCLLGLTIRLAQGLGLHRSCPPHIPVPVTLPRARIWWAILWQDSILSIVYDRASTTSATEVNTQQMPQELAETGAYHASMYRLARVVLKIVRDRAVPMSAEDQYQRIIEHRSEITNIMHESAEYLRDSRTCKNSKDTLEHWGAYLHMSYSLSELFRPAIGPAAANTQIVAFRQACIDNLVNTVEAYLGLNNMTHFARQSWAAVHRGLSSALLLGILGEHLRNDRACRLMSRFIAVIGDLTNSVDPQEISAPVRRGLAALSRLRIHESAHDATLQVVTGGRDVQSLDEHRSARVSDPSALSTPAHSETNSQQGEDHSPHAVLNNILWGNTDFREPETFVI